MAESKSGARMSLYFDKDLWRELDIESCRLKMSTTEFVRHTVKQYLENESVKEIEKLQALNARMFKYISNRLSHVELLASIAMENSNVKDSFEKYQSRLAKIKSSNKEITESIIEESL